MTKQTAPQYLTVSDAAVTMSTADRAIDAVVDSIAVALGTEPSFAHWENISRDFRAAYAAQPNRDENAAHSAWHRLTKRLADRCGLDKPKAATVQAKEKAAKREKRSKAIDAAIAECGGTIEGLRDASRAAGPAKMKIFADAIAKLEKSAAKEAADAFKARKAAIMAALKDCADEKVLARIEKALGIA